MINNNITNTFQIFVEEHQEETWNILRELTQIPAPTGKEEKRAAYILSWAKQQGMEAAFIDPAGNVQIPIGNVRDENRKILVIMAHMDTVFSETEPFQIREMDGKWFAPGIGDDTANLVNMLMTVKYIKERKQTEEIEGQDLILLFVANVGEEGLGNLKGSREIYAEYKERIAGWISLDLYIGELVNRAVGSFRYLVGVKTKGGHSFGDFGKRNAIGELAKIITMIYRQEVPKTAKTTYNVGQISGGTSVNTIASDAEMLYEFRSEANACLKKMERQFETILLTYEALRKEEVKQVELKREDWKTEEEDEVQVEVKLLGKRPGNGKIDERMEQDFTDISARVIQEYMPETEIKIEAASTDCNIPLSAGIPSVTIGTVLGGELHTKGEWIIPESMMPGQKIAIDTILGIYEYLKGKIDR